MIYISKPKLQVLGLFFPQWHHVFVPINCPWLVTNIVDLWLHCHANKRWCSTQPAAVWWRPSPPLSCSIFLSKEKAAWQKMSFSLFIRISVSRFYRCRNTFFFSCIHASAQQEQVKSNLYVAAMHICTWEYYIQYYILFPLFFLRSPERDLFLLSDTLKQTYVRT